ncbi:hypothetical protein ACFW2V_13790 [Streptomyces sp. NPDC058947]|uniref:hypothetical protein n=1 Tax=Streptomyces sp. NPDC058947 TaxID=3346675 RepID=UPI0036CA34F0
MTPDDYLGPRVHGTVRFESGIEYEVAARPRKGIGFTDETMVGFKPVDGRGTSAMQAGILRLFASSQERVGGVDGDAFFPLTKKDAEAIVAWLDGIGEAGNGEDGG